MGSKRADGLRAALDSLKPFAERAKKEIGPLAGRAKDNAKGWLTTKVVPRIREGFAYVKANPKDPKVLLSLGGAALLVLVLLIAVAAASGSKSPSGETDAKAAAQANESATKAGETAAVENRAAHPRVACRLTKQAARLAGKASKDVPLEIAVNAAGDRARLGFATDAGVAQGLSIDLGSLKASQEFSSPARGKIRAVVPLGAEGKGTFVVNGDDAGDKVRAWRTLSSDSPIVIGWADGAIAVASKPTDAPVSVWPLEGDEPPDAIRVAGAGDVGQVVVFRRRGEIMGGIIDRDQKPRGSVVKIAGAGGPAGSPVGAPTVATNGRAVAVAFADRSSASEPWGVRVGTAKLGSMPAQTSGLAIPSGGPGGAAIAPALAGLGDGRWLIAWTEGSGGDHDVRAATLDADLRPVGAPFTVSHSGSNAGQGAVALSAGQGMVAYLTLTDQGYEVWGAGVDCR